MVGGVQNMEGDIFFGRAPDLTSRRAAVTVSVEPGANIKP